MIAILDNYLAVLLNCKNYYNYENCTAIWFIHWLCYILTAIFEAPETVQPVLGWSGSNIFYSFQFLEHDLEKTFIPEFCFILSILQVKHPSKTASQTNTIVFLWWKLRNSTQDSEIIFNPSSDSIKICLVWIILLYLHITL